MFARLLSLRRIQALLVLPLLVLGAVTVQPSPASAAKWYCGSACSYQDPSSYPPGNPCANDAVTVSSVAAEGRTLQLRYSNNCETLWVRLYGGQGREKVWFYTRSGAWRADWEYFTVNNEWSRMVDDHNTQINACMGRDWGTTPWGCTAFY